MRSRSYIIASVSRHILIVLFFAAAWNAASAQGSSLRIAVLSPDGTDASRNYAALLSDPLTGSATVLDADMAVAAFGAAAIKTPFNMTTAEARRAGASMGCDFFVLVRAAYQRRSSSEREVYFESYAAIFVVSSRTGRLVDWIRPQFEAATEPEAQRMLRASVPTFAASLVTRLRDVTRAEAAEPTPPKIEEMPADGSPLAANFRSPVPYRRIKPEYTSEAFLYEVSATIEIEMDLDSAGSIIRTEVVRWAGYGLDESVISAVRSMNWRAAYRDGKPLPMRVLLRYNFKRPDK